MCLTVLMCQSWVIQRLSVKKFVRCRPAGHRSACCPIGQCVRRRPRSPAGGGVSHAKYPSSDCGPLSMAIESPTTAFFKLPGVAHRTMVLCSKGINPTKMGYLLHLQIVVLIALLRSAVWFRDRRHRNRAAPPNQMLGSRQRFEQSSAWPACSEPLRIGRSSVWRGLPEKVIP